MDVDLSRLLFKIGGALTAILVLAGGIYFCGGSGSPSSLKTGCIAAGHLPMDPLLPKCMEQAKAECTSGDEAARSACAKAVGYKLLGGAPSPQPAP